VTSDQDLQADAAEREGVLCRTEASAHRFLGRADRQRARRSAPPASGFFTLAKKGDRWLLLDPDGNAFFHLGICSFGFTEDYTYTQERQGIYEWLPPTGGDPYSVGWHRDGYWHDKAFSFLRSNLVRKYGTAYEPR
jgi:hypothetical protein